MYFLSLSGGLDSTVLCASLLAESGRENVRPVFLRYGSKHNRWEREAAERVCAHYGLHLLAPDISPIFAQLGSALLGHDSRRIPEAGYDKQSMEQTAVPGRNLIFASILAAMAESAGGGTIALATHGGDHHLYPDCRPGFNESLARTVQESSGGRVALSTPFAALGKSDIVALGLKLRVPFALTRSCYQDSPLSCGRCGTCRERLRAFADNGLEDAIAYA